MTRIRKTRSQNTEKRKFSLSRKEWRELRDSIEPITLDNFFVQNLGLSAAPAKDSDDESSSDDETFEGGSRQGIEYKILVRVKCRTDNPLLCGEMVPFAGMWARYYENKAGQPGKLIEEDTIISEGGAKGEPWVGGGPNSGKNLQVDFPCEIFYRQEFAFVDRSTPGFEDEEGNETNSVENTTEPGEIRTGLQTFDIVLRDEPSFTLRADRYVKYEFESAYLIQDPRPLKMGETIGFRRQISFIYGTLNKLTFTQSRPANW